MKAYQSLADAALFRSVAVIPEQIMFGLALAKDPQLRLSAETRRNLELGRLFCQVFESVSEKAFTPVNRSAATIAAGIQELSPQDLEKWHAPIVSVSITISTVLSGTDVSSTKLDESIDTLRQFTGFARQKLSGSSEAELVR